MVINCPQETRPRREHDDESKEEGLMLILDLLQNFDTPYKEELATLEQESKVLERENLDLLYKLKYARVSAKETLIEVCFHHKLRVFEQKILHFDSSQLTEARGFIRKKGSYRS